MPTPNTDKPSVQSTLLALGKRSGSDRRRGRPRQRALRVQRLPRHLRLLHPRPHHLPIRRPPPAVVAEARGIIPHQLSGGVRLSSSSSPGTGWRRPFGSSTVRATATPMRTIPTPVPRVYSSSYRAHGHRPLPRPDTAGAARSSRRPTSPRQPGWPTDTKNSASSTGVPGAANGSWADQPLNSRR